SFCVEFVVIGGEGRFIGKLITDELGMVKSTE
ncbi:MAG: hypothetical protein ACI9LA_002054, partial [Bacteroidia bacterium]